MAAAATQPRVQFSAGLFCHARQAIAAMSPALFIDIIAGEIEARTKRFVMVYS
jgi:hypothetical protein